MFSVIIPTWNNLEFLKLCVDSLRKHSQYDHEIIIHVNDGSDGTLAWVKAQGLKYSHTEKNIGVCLAVNHLAAQTSREWVLYMNDDMVACPGWDSAFAQAIASTNTDLALFFSTLIQADNGKNPNILKQDFGTTPQNYDEPRLLRECFSEVRDDVEGGSSQPTLFHRKWWLMVGGYSLEYSPGMSSDDDLLMKFWVIGCRHFRIVGASRFYHFSCKSTGRIRHNMGGRIFVMKWGITQAEFYRRYMSQLLRTTPAQLVARHSHLFPRATLRGKLRRAGYGLFCDYPLQDIETWDTASGQGSWNSDATVFPEQNWLIISHAFNMDGRAASLTITDKLPYLISNGIKVSVISGAQGNRDQNFLHFQLLPWGPSGLRFDLRHLIAMKFGRGMLYRLFGFLLSSLLLPFRIIERALFGLQGQSSWALPATIRSLLLIRKNRPDLIYTTGGAYSAHLAGYWLKKFTGIKWIAEIHDPMVIAGGKKARNERFMEKLEGYICRNADLVWWFTDGALNSARQRYPELGKRGIAILPGAERIESHATYQRRQQMIIGHFGSLSGTRSLFPVVQAVATLIEQQPDIRSAMRIHVYGGNIDSRAMKEISHHKLDDVFVCFGRLEKSPQSGRSGREQVIDLMHQADCLLLVHGSIEDCREYIPSKLYEYFWAGRPVIALTYNNPQLDRMLSERNYYNAASDRQDEIVAIIARAYADWKEDKLPQTSVSPIGTKQSVDAILDALGLPHR
jgi:glycosyltransferase involved in cell wall biosynthesis